MEIYTTPNKWLPIFMERIPSDQIPPEYRAIKNGRRRSSLWNALTRNKVDLDFDSVQTITADVAAGNFLKLEYDITERKTVIK